MEANKILKADLLDILFEEEIKNTALMIYEKPITGELQLLL